MIAHTMHNIRVTNIRRSTIDGYEDGIDLDIALTIEGKTINLQATLLPAEDGSDYFGTWGDGAGHWLSAPELLTAEQIREVAAAAEDAAPRPSEISDD